MTPPVVTGSARCIGCAGVAPDITGPTHEYCGHLLSLCLIPEKGASFSVGERGIRWVIERKSQFTWLTPPNSLGNITVVDAGGWESAADHAQQVRAWAESAWSAWAEHHDTVHEWASSMLEG